MSLTIEQLTQMEKQVADLRAILSDMNGNQGIHDKLKLAMLVTAKMQAESLIKFVRGLEPDADESDLEIVYSVYVSAYKVLSTYYGVAKSK